MGASLERSTAMSASPSAEVVRRGFAPMTGLNVESISSHRWEDSNGPRGQRVLISTRDGKSLAAIYCDVKDATAGAVLFHGNGMTHEDMVDFARVYTNAGVAVLAITLRGYGDSTGGDGSVPVDGEAGMYLDATAAVDYMLARNFSPERLVAHGFSLGGSMAAAAACHHKLGGLVLDHTFTSALDETAHVG